MALAEVVEVVPDVIPLGPAFAWQDATGQWFFTPHKSQAPAGAIVVERVSVEGKIILDERHTGYGRFIRDAVQVD